MRLNPFVSSSRDQDDVAVARLSKRNQYNSSNNNNTNNRNRRPSQQQQRGSSATRKKSMNAPQGRGRSSSQNRYRSSGRDAPPGDDDMMNTSTSNLSYAGGSAAARNHISRGRAPPTTPRRKSNSNIKVLGTAEGAGGRGGTRKKREPSGPIDLDEAMDREMERRRSRSRNNSQQRRPSTNTGAVASKASRPSKTATSRTYSLSSSFEDDHRNPAEDEDHDDDSNSEKEMNRSRYSRRPSQAAAARRGRSRERVNGGYNSSGPEDEGEDDDNQAEEGFGGSGSRAKVIPSQRGRSSSRNRTSRDVSPLSLGITDDEDEDYDRAAGATPRRRRPSQQPQQRTRSVSRNSRGGRSTSPHHRRASASPGPPPARRRPSQHRSSGGGGAAGDRGDRGQYSRNRNPNIKSNSSKSRSKSQAVESQDNNKRKSWGKMLASPFMGLKTKGKKPDAPQYDEDEADILSDTGMNDDEYYPEEEDEERRRVPRRGSGRREASDDHRYGPAPVEQPQPPKFDINKVIKVSDSYLVPKPETYANLYEYDNFPAIDRVPTAIGYRSDDSLPDDADEADDKSFTSRYTIDVKSVRSSKLKKKNEDGISIYGHREDGDFSHDENDDKYAQYLAGAEANEVLSDSSESCPPKWHSALDAEDSDWFDDDDEEAMKKASGRGKNKKYQVSSKDKQKRSSNKKSKKAAAKAAKAKAKGAVPVAATKEEAALNAEAKLDEEGEAMGDAIVANRSEGSDLRPKQRQQRSAMGLSEDSDDETEGDDDDMTGAKNRHRKQQGVQKGGRRNGNFKLADAASILTDNSYEEMDKPSKAKGIMMNPNIGKGKLQNMKDLKAKAKSRGLASRFKGFRLGSRVTDDASSSDDSSYGTDNMHLDPSQSIYSGFDQSLAQLEDDEWRESTATHNMMRNNRKELLELDEMDEASVKIDPNQVSCSIFPFGLTALALGGGNSTSCFYNQSGEPQRPEDAPLDSVQIQRLKDSKYDMENKPKVEVILQDLQDPLADKFDQLEKSKQKHKRELQREQEFQQEIERKERAELLRKKKEIREAEQKKVQLAQKQDLDLQEAPDLNRGKSPSFVMDITDWVLQLDNDTPRRKSLSNHAPTTPRTNGRNEPSPIDELPFSTISVPTATMDSDDIAPKQAWRRGKKEKKPTARSSAKTPEKRRTDPKKSNDKKKKGWFRR